MGYLVDWQSNENTFAIQNKNFFIEKLKTANDRAKSNFYFGYTKDDITEYYLEEYQDRYSQDKNNIEFINGGQIRVPGQRVSGNINGNLTGARNSEVSFSDGRMVYMPNNIGYDCNVIGGKFRFVPELNTIKTVYKNNYFKKMYKLNINTSQYKAGGGVTKEYINESSEIFDSENYLVCNSISIYKLNSNGTAFTKYGSFSLSSATNVDVFCPYFHYWCRYPRQNKPAEKDLVFLPLLFSLSLYRGTPLHSTFLSINQGFQVVFTEDGADRVPTPNPHLFGYSVNYDNAAYAPVYFYNPSYTPVSGLCADKSYFEKLFNAVGWEWSYNKDDVIDPNGNVNKPTYPGQPTNPTGGGGGTGDNISDEIPMPTPSFLPNNTAYNRYWLKGSDINSLQTFLFSDTFLNDVKRLWTDPAEYMIKLAYYPFDGVAHDYNGTANATVSVGGIASEISGFAMLNNYNNKFFGGTLDITEYYGTYLDYSPYTTAEIYIPYIGYRQINLSDVMGKTLEIQYAVDFDTGILTAFVLSDSTPLTMYSAPFGVEVALSGSNANQVAQSVLGMVGNVVSAAGGVVSLITSAGASAPVAVPQITGAAGNLVNQVMNLDISPRNFGSPSPTTALYAPQQPFIVLHRPITAEPADFAALNGYAAGYSGLVSSFTGYLKASSVKLSCDTKVSQAEQQEIISLLLGGVYIG